MPRLAIAAVWTPRAGARPRIAPALFLWDARSTRLGGVTEPSAAVAAPAHSVHRVCIPRSTSIAGQLSSPVMRGVGSSKSTGPSGQPTKVGDRREQNECLNAPLLLSKCALLLGPHAWLPRVPHAASRISRTSSRTRWNSSGGARHIVRKVFRKGSRTCGWPPTLGKVWTSISNRISGLDNDPSRDRMDTAEMLADHRIDGRAIRAVGDVDGDLGDVVEARARILQQLSEVAQGEFGLGAGILGATAGADRALAIERRSGLATNEQLRGAGGDHAALPGEVLAVPIGVIVFPVAGDGGSAGCRRQRLGDWRFKIAAIKPYASCRDAHSAIDAARRILARYELKP